MLNWLFKKKKEKKMVVDIQAIQEQLSRYKVFQWVKSENAGNMCKLANIQQDDDAVYIVFDDGTRINYEFMDEFVKGIEFDVDMDTMMGDARPAPQAQVGKVTLGTPAQIQISPIRALLDKQKHNPTEVQISITLNMPNKQLFDVISASFDNAELEILDYVVLGVNIETVRDAIKQTLAEYYGGE